MPFTDRFQLLGLKRDEGARTFEAREIATGRPVYVHLFANPRSPFNRALLARMDSLPDSERARIIDRGEHEGGIYIVTDRLAEHPGLREWLSEVKASERKALDAGGAWRIPVPAPPPVAEPAEKLFETAPRPPLEPVFDPGPAPAAESKLTNSGELTLEMPKILAARKEEPRPAPVPPPAPGEPGEFTQQFVKPVMRPASASPPQPSNPDEPGEFTQQFAPKVMRPTPLPQAPPASSSSASEPGEFTLQFAAPVPKPAQKPPGQPTPSAPELGEFTSLFESHKPAPPAPGKSPQTHGEFTSLFQTPQRPTPAPAPRVPPPQPPQQSLQGHGEFTEMFQAQRAAPPAPPADRPSDELSFLFRSQTPSSPVAPPSPRITPVPPPRGKSRGEFTQIFGEGDLPKPPSPSASGPLSATQSPNATQVFSAPRVNPNVTALMPSAPQGPDEYDQMFSKPASLTLGQAAPAPPPRLRIPEPLKPVRNKSLLPLIFLGGGAVLLIVALVVYLVMRHHSA